MHHSTRRGDGLDRLILLEALESVRETYPASRAVMRAQLDRLTGLAGLDTIEIGIIPDTHLYTVAPGHGFWIFDDRVMLELISAELIVNESSEMALYTQIWNELWSIAAKGTEAQAALFKVATHYRDTASA